MEILTMKKMFYFICLSTTIFVSCNQSPGTPKPLPVTAEVTRLVEMQVPVTIEVTRIKEAVITQPAIESPIAIDNPNYSGTYVRSAGEDIYQGGGCVLKTIHEIITTDAFDNLSFELFCTRGAPSYNIGYAMETVLFEHYVSNMAVWSSPFGECHLVFEFGIDEVTVAQIGHHCGFGGGVYANGHYRLEDSQVPELGCMSLNAPDPCLYNP